MARFDIGDRVIFRLGEREDVECPICHTQLWNDEPEKILTKASNKEYIINRINYFGLLPTVCSQLICMGVLDYPPFDYELKEIPDTSNKAKLFGAYESELTPIDQSHPIMQEGRFR